MFGRRTEYVEQFRIEKMFFGPGPRPDLTSAHPRFFFLKYFPSLKNPQFVTAGRASHMRGTDRVIGLSFNGVSRAYPLWIMDNYHSCNDVINGVPVIVNHCEKCGSGAAFIAQHGEERLTFENPGIYNAGLTLRDDQTGSFWNHFEGVALYGPLRGTMLKPVPCYQCTWEEWVALHPETEVLIYPENPLHRDGRHGHGAAEDLGSRGLGTGLGPFFVRTLNVPLDTRMAEHIAVLGVNIDAGVKAYPLEEVQRHGGVVNDQLGEIPIVVFLRAPNSHMMAAYWRVIDGRVLQFDRRGPHFVDEQTDSLWTIEGRAIDGPSKGRALTPVNFTFLKWHAWALYHPETELFRSDRLEAKGVELGSFQPFFQRLHRAGYPFQVVNEIARILLPHQAERGIVIRLQGHRMNLYRFETRGAARDYERLERHALRGGQYVLTSDPEEQFADIYQNEPLPDDQIAWSPLLEEPRFRRAIMSLDDDTPDPIDVGLIDALEKLGRAGYRVSAPTRLPLDSLPVGALRGIAVTIASDPFLIYKFQDAPAADRFIREKGHSVRIGRFVFRSDPRDQYEYPQFGTGSRPEDEVSWSSLVADERFLGALRPLEDEDSLDRTVVKE